MYVFESRVRYSEIGADGRLTTEKLIDYFQDCSTFQSEDLGAGVKYLRDKNLAWIIVYWRAEILRMPGLGEKIRVGTLPYEMNGTSICSKSGSTCTMIPGRYGFRKSREL